jgi:hypothetical protein
VNISKEKTRELWDKWWQTYPELNRFNQEFKIKTYKNQLLLMVLEER